MARLLTTPSALVRRQSVMTGMRQRSAAGFMGIPERTSSMARRKSSDVHFVDFRANKPNVTS